MKSMPTSVSSKAIRIHNRFFCSFACTLHWRGKNKNKISWKFCVFNEMEMRKIKSVLEVKQTENFIRCLISLLIGMDEVTTTRIRGTENWFQRIQTQEINTEGIFQRHGIQFYMLLSFYSFFSFF